MTLITRRSFVAATAGAIAVPAVPTVPTVPSRPASGSKPAQQRPLTDRDFYYLHGGEHYMSSLSSAEPRLSGNPFDEHLKPGGKRKTVRRRFVPLAAAARFIVVALQWEHTIGDYPESYHALSLDERDAQFERMYVATKARDLPEPESYVAIPPGLALSTEHNWIDCPRLTREAALHAAAEANRQTWHGIDFGDDFDGMAWNVVVEIGEMCAEVPGVVVLEFAASGVGTMSEHCDLPVRVVLPTADELARYAVAYAITEGGA